MSERGHQRLSSVLGTLVRFAPDIVAKRFWASEPAILIQDQAAMRNVDSKIRSPRFDCCGQDAPRRLLQQYPPQSGPGGLSACRRYVPNRTHAPQQYQAYIVCFDSSHVYL